MADRSFLRTRLAPVLCLLAAAIGCPDDRVPTTVLPGGVDVAALLPEHRALVRVTLAIDGGALAETDLDLGDDLALSGSFDVQNVEAAIERTMTVRLYGRFSPTSEEVVLGRLEKPITLQPEQDVEVAFAASDVFNTCDGEPGACAVLFDANRNGLSNIEDLLERTRSAGRGIDPAPQAPYLVTSSEQLQFPSGVRLGTFSRQLVVLENFGSNPVTVTEASVVGGQGFSISILDPTGQSVAPPGRELTGDAFRVIAPGQEAFVAVSFTPVNSFVTTGALFVRVRDEVTRVEQTARVKLIANPEGELRPADPQYVEPDLGNVGVDGGSLPVVAFPNAQLQSGDALIAEDALGAGLRQSGASLTLVDGAESIAFPADAAFAVDVRAGERFSTAIDGLTSDIDIAVVEVGTDGAVVGLACPACRSANAGTSPEAVEFKNDGAARRVVVIFGRIEPESDEPENEGALTVAETVSFRCSSTVSFGPEFASVDPVLPTTGPLEGGIPVTLRGSGFDPRARVLVGQAEALDVAISRGDDGNDTVTFTLPAAVGVENPASIIVENPADGGDGQAATLLESFSYQPPAPVVDEIRPDVAPTTGGTTPVTIIGRFFSARQGPPQVSFGTVTIDATFVSASELTVTPPPHIDPLTSATVSVKVRNRLVADDGATVSLGSASNGVAFRYLVPAGAAPTLTAIAPATGSVDGNTRVTLSGTDFRNGAQVFFGARSATCDTPASTTAVSCFTPPADAPGPVDIIVVNADGQSAKLDAGYAYEIPSPTISSVFPARGITDGGTLLVVEGGGFRPGARVTFVQGETTRAATAATRVSGTTMLVTTPAGTSGAARIVITNLDTQDVDADFTYFAPDAATPPPAITAINPAVGDAAGGFPVTVTGTGFLAPAVVFGSSNVQVLSFVDRDPPSLDEVTVIAPASPTGVAAAVTVQIINDDGQSATNGFNYTFSAAAPPRIDRVDPSTFVAGQTTTFTISGARFDAGARVIVGGLQASLQSVSSTTIRATLTGQLGAGTVMVVVENPNGGAVSAPITVVAPGGGGTPVVTNVSTSDVHANVAGDVITIFGDNLDQGALEVLTSANGQGAVAVAPRILTRGKNVIVLELPALASTTASTRHTLSLRFSGAGVTTLTVPLVAHRPLILFSEGGQGRETVGATELVFFGEFLNPAALVGVDFVGPTASLPCEISTATERTIVCSLTDGPPAGTVLRALLTWQGTFNGQAQAPLEVAGADIGLIDELAGPSLSTGPATVPGATDFSILPQTVAVSIPGLDPRVFEGAAPEVVFFGGSVVAVNAVASADALTLNFTAGRFSVFQSSTNFQVQTASGGIVADGQLAVGRRTVAGDDGPRFLAWNTDTTLKNRFLLAGDEARLTALRPANPSIPPIPLAATRSGQDLTLTDLSPLAPGTWVVCYSDQLGFCVETSEGLTLVVEGVNTEAFENIENGLAFGTVISDVVEDGGTDRYFFLNDQPGLVDVSFNNQCAAGMNAVLTTRQGTVVGNLCSRLSSFDLLSGEHVVTITNGTGVATDYSLVVTPRGGTGEGEGEGEGEVGLCGNGLVDVGEECDEGPNNGIPFNAVGTVQIVCDSSCLEPVNPELTVTAPNNIARMITSGDDDVFPVEEITTTRELGVFTTLRAGAEPITNCSGAITLIIEDQNGIALATSSTGNGGCAFASVTLPPGFYRARVRATQPGASFPYRIGAFVGPVGACVGGTGDNVLQVGEACDDGDTGSATCSPSCLELFEPDSQAQPQLVSLSTALSIDRALVIGEGADFIAFDVPATSTFSMQMTAREGTAFCGSAPLGATLIDPIGNVTAFSLDNNLCPAGAVVLQPGRHVLGLSANTQAIRYTVSLGLTPSGGGPVCPNGLVEAGESCDDDNGAPDDGCNQLCQVESGFTCDGSPSVCTPTGPSCGNQLVEAGEGCDNNPASGDGCDEFCQVEPGFDCVGSPSVCTPTAFCGNGQIEGAEECDDAGNQAPGCSDLCVVDPGFVCVGSPSICSTAPRSCAEVLALNPAAPSGLHTIDPDGPGPNGAVQVECDMTFDGGGWTLIMATAGDVPGNLGVQPARSGSPTRFDLQTMQAITSSSTQVHIRTAPNTSPFFTAGVQRFVTSRPGTTPIQNLRQGAVLYTAQAQFNPDDFTGPLVNTLSIFCQPTTEVYPAIYHACGHDGLHLQATIAQWNFSGPLEHLEVYVRDAPVPQSCEEIFAADPSAPSGGFYFVEPGLPGSGTYQQCNTSSLACGNGVIDVAPPSGPQGATELISGLSLNGGAGAGVAVDDQGTVYAVQNNNGSIRRRTAAGTVDSLVPPFTFANGADIEVGPDGFLYVADGFGFGGGGTGQVFRVNPANGATSVFLSGIQNPSGIAFDGPSILVASFNAQTINRFAFPSGTPLGQLGGTLGFNPSDIELGPDGDLYVAGFDPGFAPRTAIVRLDPSGFATTFADVGQLDETATDPHSLAFDGVGDLWVSHYNGLKLVRYTSDGTPTIFPGGFVGDDAINGLAIGADGAIFTVTNGGRTTGTAAVIRIDGLAAGAGTETCDDGFTADFDGCSSTCQVEPGFTCNGEPSVCFGP